MIYNNDIDPNMRMWEKQNKFDIKMKKDKSIIYENWNTAELFHYLMDNDVFDVDDDFEDWKNNRSELIKMCKEL